MAERNSCENTETLTPLAKELAANLITKH